MVRRCPSTAKLRHFGAHSTANFGEILCKQHGPHGLSAASLTAGRPLQSERQKYLLANNSPDARTDYHIGRPLSDRALWFECGRSRRTALTSGSFRVDELAAIVLDDQAEGNSRPRNQERPHAQGRRRTAW